MDEVVEMYHAELVKCNPKIGELYPIDFCKEDFAISMAFAICGITAILGGYCDGLKDDPTNGIWDFLNIVCLRMGACATHAGALAAVKKFAASV